MPLELTKETLTWKQRKGNQHSRILLEGDMIVPDSKPDVKEVLRCSGRVRLEEVKAAEEKVSIHGELLIWVLYRAIGGEKPIYAMSSTLPIQETLYVEGLETEDIVEVDLDLEHLECQLINDRKIGLRAVIEAEVEVEGRRSWQMVSGIQGNQAQLLWKKITTEQPVTEKKDRFTVKHTITLPTEQPAIGEVLDTNLTISNMDIRPMDGKAAVRGTLRFSAIYGAQDSGMPIVVEEEIPFHGFVEGSGVTPQTWTEIRLHMLEEDIRPSVDEDGEARLIEITVVIGADMKATQVAETEIVADAYGLEMDLVPTKEEAVFPVPVGTAQNRFTMKETMTLEAGEQPMMQAVTAWGEVHMSDVSVGTDTVEAEGVLDVEVLYFCQEDDNPLCVIRRGFPFHRSIEVKGASVADTAQVRGVLEELDFRLLTEREGEMRAQILLDVLVNGEERMEVVTDLREGEDAEGGKRPGAVIYVVQEGDTLWNIAKKYRTTEERILMVNEIENPDRLYPGQKLLILR